MIHTQHKKLVDMFNSRAKGRDFKVFNRGHARLMQLPNGDIQALLTNGYGKNPALIPFALIATDNTLTLQRAIPPTSVMEKNLFSKLAGRYTGWVRSMTTQYGLHENSLRYFGGPSCNAAKNVPCSVGLKIDLTTGLPIAYDQDVVIRTDRKKSQPVYQHVNAVLKVMDVLFRLGNLTVERQPYSPGEWSALAKLPTFDMNEDSLADHATAAFTQAKTRTGGIHSTYNYTAGLYQVRNIENWYTSVRRVAARDLRYKLQRHYECFYREVVTP